MGTKKTEEKCLHIFEVNSRVRPEGLCPVLRVFTAIPWTARKSPSPSQIQRRITMGGEISAAEREQAKRRISFGLWHPSGVTTGQ